MIGSPKEWLGLIGILLVGLLEAAWEWAAGWPWWVWAVLALCAALAVLWVIL